jgi:hypothetical protein
MSVGRGQLFRTYSLLSGKSQMFLIRRIQSNLSRFQRKMKLALELGVEILPQCHYIPGLADHIVKIANRVVRICVIFRSWNYDLEGAQWYIREVETT